MTPAHTVQQRGARREPAAISSSAGRRGAGRRRPKAWVKNQEGASSDGSSAPPAILLLGLSPSKQHGDQSGLPEPGRWGLNGEPVRGLRPVVSGEGAASVWRVCRRLLRRIRCEHPRLNRDLGSLTIFEGQQVGTSGKIDPLRLDGTRQREGAVL